MALEIIIFGKDTWHYTSDARQDYTNKGYTVDYRNVVKTPELLPEMLKFSGGKRAVPVMVEQGKVTIGYGGSWGVWFPGWEPGKAAISD